MVAQRTIKDFQQEILTWYADNKRDFPWRSLPFDPQKQQRDPYKILLAEVMSQQTQINRVVTKYNEWVKAFPAIHDLAQAPVSDILVYWSGLGYNRRVLNLKKTAEIIVSNYHGEFPRTENELMALPGIGTYTARALLCFSFNQHVAVVDTNVRKVILTQLHVSEKEIAQVADLLLPQGKAYDWNQAMMDYAAVTLREHKIPIPKQSKFIGSHRYYRGKVLKLLLARKLIEVKELGKLLREDYSKNHKNWLDSLLQELLEEGFILCKHGAIELAR